MDDITPRTMIIRDQAGIEWAQEVDPLSGEVTLTRLTPHASRSALANATRRVVKKIVDVVAPRADHADVALQHLFASNPNSRVDAEAMLARILPKLPPETAKAVVDSYVRSRLS